jgi:hypothetical protein
LKVTTGQKSQPMYDWAVAASPQVSMPMGAVLTSVGAPLSSTPLLPLLSPPAGRAGRHDDEKGGPAHSEDPMSPHPQYPTCVDPTYCSVAKLWQEPWLHVPWPMRQ